MSKNVNKYERQIDFSTHRGIVKDFKSDIRILESKLSSNKLTSNATEIANQQLIERNNDDNDRIEELLDDQHRLTQQIKALQTFNLNLQWQLACLKSKKEVSCDHVYECGCGMSICNNCTKISECKYCNEYNTCCNHCNRSTKLCNDQLCANYYTQRFDNCECGSEHCNFCSLRIIDGIK